MTEHNLQEIDLDWFWMLPSKQVLHFASGGNGFIPDHVASNLSTQDAIFEFVYGLDFQCSFITVDENLPVGFSLPQRQRYLESFSDFSKRGVFSFDVEDEPRFGASYRLVTMPSVSMEIRSIPAEVASYFDQCTKLSLSISQNDKKRVIGIQS